MFKPPYNWNTAIIGDNHQSINLVDQRKDSHVMGSIANDIVWYSDCLDTAQSSGKSHACSVYHIRFIYEEFDDTKGINIIRKSKKDRQYNG
jgi:hypothetical protein